MTGSLPILTITMETIGTLLMCPWILTMTFGPSRRRHLDDIRQLCCSAILRVPEGKTTELMFFTLFSHMGDPPTVQITLVRCGSYHHTNIEDLQHTYGARLLDYLYE